MRLLRGVVPVTLDPATYKFEIGRAKLLLDGADVSATPGVAAPGASAGPLRLKASEQSWVEVIDGRSQIVFSRMLQPGEMVALDGVLPLRIKVGNAAATQLSYRGSAVDLAASTRDNVARLELK